jgi:hypothetical protein
MGGVAWPGVVCRWRTIKYLLTQSLPEEDDGCMLALLGGVARAAVGIAFALSAVWKLRHAGEFRVVFRWLAPRAVADRRVVAALVPGGELVLAAALIVPLRVGRPAALVALMVLAGFTLAWDYAGAGATGCGCWSQVNVLDEPTAARLLLVRNGVLGSLAVVGAIASGRLPSAPGEMFVVAAGAMVAVLVMEIPQVGAVLASAARARSAAGRAR